MSSSSSPSKMKKKMKVKLNLWVDEEGLTGVLERLDKLNSENATMEEKLTALQSLLLLQHDGEEEEEGGEETHSSSSSSYTEGSHSSMSTTSLPPPIEDVHVSEDEDQPVVLVVCTKNTTTLALLPAKANHPHHDDGDRIIRPVAAVPGKRRKAILLASHATGRLYTIGTPLDHLDLPPHFPLAPGITWNALPSIPTGVFFSETGGAASFMGDKLYLAQYNSSRGKVYDMRTSEWSSWDYPHFSPVVGDVYMWPLPDRNRLIIYSVETSCLFEFNPTTNVSEPINTNFNLGNGPPIPVAFHNNIIYVVNDSKLYAYDYPERCWFNEPVRFTAPVSFPPCIPISPHDLPTSVVDVHLVPVGPQNLCCFWELSRPSEHFFRVQYAKFTPVAVRDGNESYVRARVISVKTYEIEGSAILSCIALPRLSSQTGGGEQEVERVKGFGGGQGAGEDATSDDGNSDDKSVHCE